MKINTFKAKNVHGYLDFDITFYSEITFLIGINGAGKTSALKLILGLTSPTYQYLSQIAYTYCEVICSTIQDEKDIVIRAEQNAIDNTFMISLTIKNELFEMSSIPIKKSIRTDDSSFDVEESFLIDQRNKESFDAMDITKKIREFTTPKFLGLDRRIYEGREIDNRFRNRRIQGKTLRRPFENYPESPAIDYSLFEVQTLVFDYIRKIAFEQSQISEDFKRKIFTQSFLFVEDNYVGSIPETSEIIKRKKEVLSAIDNLGIMYLDYSVNSFFSKIETIAKSNEKIDTEDKDFSKKNYSKEYLEILIKWNNNGSQLKRIDDIIKYSQEYQQKIAELRAPIKRLETIATAFLKEGKKSLQVAPDGEIKVILKNGKATSIYELSSGEKQIIIMIAHLIFEEDQNKKTTGIFIIDEPELSLHIAWQEIFVNSIMEASPKTQFILATHSPSIVARVDKEKYCQDLNKLNY